MYNEYRKLFSFQHESSWLSYVAVDSMLQLSVVMYFASITSRFQSV